MGEAGLGTLATRGEDPTLCRPTEAAGLGTLATRGEDPILCRPKEAAGLGTKSRRSERRRRQHKERNGQEWKEILYCASQRPRGWKTFLTTEMFGGTPPPASARTTPAPEYFRAALEALASRGLDWQEEDRVWSKGSG